MKARNLLTAVLALGVAGFFGSPAMADWSTSFEAGEGFAAEATIVGVDGWTGASASRGIATASEITAPTGTQSARVLNFNTPSTGFTSGTLSAVDRVGVVGGAWTGYAGLKMAAKTNVAGFGLAVLGGRDTGNNAGVYFGILDDKFAYYNGAWTQTTEAYTPGVFYDFDVIVHGDGSGGGSWDLTISNGDLGSPIILAGLALRFPSVNYLDGWLIQSNRNTTATGNANDGDLYFDDMYISSSIPEPASLVLIGFGGLMMLCRRHQG